MKNLLIILSLLIAGMHLNAQEKAGTYREELPDIFLDRNVSLHIVSPEPIRYVDISSQAVVGDLPEANVLRLKWLPNTVQHEFWRSGSLGVVTVIGESFIAQYDLHFLEDAPEEFVATIFNILPGHTRPLDVPVDPTTPELRRHATTMLAMRPPQPIRKAKAYGITAELNRIYTVGDLVMLDITYRNASNLPYDIDEMRFKIEDRKITKATNVQSIEARPVWQLYPNGTFRKSHRNIYALKKATFPGNKVLNVELSEKQISGRTVNLKIKYGDILKADSF